MKRVLLFRSAVLAVVLALLSLHNASAQKVALKSNALYLLSATPNLSLEVGLAPNWTLDINGGVNPFTFKDNRKWKHYQGQIEARYWFCERFYRHYLGLHAGGGEFNVGRMPGILPRFSEENRYEGWAVKAGLSYGYSFVLSGRWNMEATLGLGVVYADYDKFACTLCGDRLSSGAGFHFAPTRAGITFIYMIR